METRKVVIKPETNAYDLNAILQCLFHCPTLMENMTNYTDLNPDTIISQFWNLFRRYYNDYTSNLSIEQFTDSILKLKPSFPMAMHNRTENTVAHLFNFLSQQMQTDHENIRSFPLSHITLLSLPVPRSAYSLSIPVIQMQLHSDFSKYNIATETMHTLLVFGYIRTIVNIDKNIPLDINHLFIEIALECAHYRFKARIRKSDQNPQT